MDFPFKVPRKKQRSGQKSRNGHTIIHPPTSASKNNIDLSNDREGDYYHCTNDHINDMNNPGDGSSDSSNFSQGDPERRRRQQQRNKEKNESRKRQQTKDQLAASQRKWDNKREGYSMDGAYDHASNQSMRCFDGVQIDKPRNEEAAKVVKDVDHLRPKMSRGKNHSSSAFANLGQSPFAGDGVYDPLELAQERQGSDRKSRRGLNTNEYTKSMGSHMDNITQAKFGDGSMTSKRNRQKKKARARKEVINVDRDEGIDGSGGKKRKTSSHYFEKSNTSPGSPSSFCVNQGDDDFHADGWGSHGSGESEVNMMTALDAAKEYVQPGSQPVSLTVTRDPKKGAASKQKRCKCFAVSSLTCSCFILLC